MSDQEQSNKISINKAMKKPINWLSWLFVVVISVLICIPVFIIVYRYIPAISIAGLRVDHVITFLPLLAVVTYLVIKFRLIIYILGSAALVWLSIMAVTGRYTFKDLSYDYSAMLYALNEGAVPIKFLEKKLKFTNEDRIRQAIDYQNIRPFAVELAVRNFRDYSDVSPGTQIIQSFSVFKEIYNRWEYVHDPQFEDYYASASETMSFFNTSEGVFPGDCDDYSIFIAACVKAIGAEVRLVRTRVEQPDGESIGHIYPEVKIGDQKALESAIYLIKEKLFPKESKGKDIFYHIDENGDVWLNFDYNDAFPGGAYQSKLRVSEIEV